MGIFDKLIGSQDIKLTPKSALALAAMTMIGIDGSIEDEEVDTLRRIVRGDGQAFDQAFKAYKGKTVSECACKQHLCRSETKDCNDSRFAGHCNGGWDACRSGKGIDAVIH